MEYRSDIDGLRAVAILPVVLGHAALGPFEGGFVGVDVFFVISGYLITSIIAGEMEEERFSIAKFYERRIRRLLPALMALLAICIAVGSFVLLEEDRVQFGNSVIATTFFGSNFFFWSQVGYFDGPALTKPLLHTWSLAVEEQFYIVFPVALFILYKYCRSYLAPALFAATALSFILAAVSVHKAPSAAFYLLPTRAWEMLIGSLLALGAVPPISSPRLRDAASLLGIALIAFAVFTYTEGTTFPGPAALLPCLGTALIIHAGQAGPSVVGRLLSLKPVVFIGQISYSLYLWHWPVIVFTSYMLVHKPNVPTMAGAVALSILLATLSWRYIEQPFRHSRRSRSTVFRSAVLAMSAAAAAGLLASLSMLGPRTEPEVERLLAFRNSKNLNEPVCAANYDRQLDPNGGCSLGNPETASVFLWGDSHGDSLWPAFEQIHQRLSAEVTYGVSASCLPLVGVGSDAKCIADNENRLNFILGNANITHVVLAGRWTAALDGRAVDLGPAETNSNLPPFIDRNGKHYGISTPERRAVFRSALSATIQPLLKSGKTVVLIYPIPEVGYDVPSTLARLVAKGEEPENFKVPQEYYRSRHAYVIEALDALGHHPRLLRVRPDAHLCADGNCDTYRDGAALYYDDDHLSREGAAQLMPAIEQALAGPSS